MAGTWADWNRRGRGKKDAGFQGHASWISSVINLANTSTIQMQYGKRRF
jgi:hypothetical protein